MGIYEVVALFGPAFGPSIGGIGGYAGLEIDRLGS